MAQNATANSMNYDDLIPNEDNAIKLYRVAEVAKIIRVKKSYVNELIYTGRLGAIRLSERRIMIPESSLKSFIWKELGKVKKISSPNLRKGGEPRSSSKKKRT